MVSNTRGIMNEDTATITPHAFLAGGRVAGALARSTDGSATPAGPISSWPIGLESETIARVVAQPALTEFRSLSRRRFTASVRASSPPIWRARSCS